MHVACSVEGCERKVHARGWCGRHYHSWRNHGDPMAVSRAPSVHSSDLAERVFPKIGVDNPLGCWEWLASKNERGYGRVRDAERGEMKAHRAVYELLMGDIPEGMELDHLCRNPSCVNPDHLEPVTHRENMVRSPLLGAGLIRDGYMEVGK